MRGGFTMPLTGVGTRNESTLYLGVSGTTQTPPRLDGPPLSRQPAYYIAAATGHISRGYYVWAGAGYQPTAIGETVRTIKVTRCSPAQSLAGDPVPLQGLPQTRCTFLLGDDRRVDRVGAPRRIHSHGTGGCGGHGQAVGVHDSPADANDYVVLPNSGGEGIFSGPTFLYTYRDIAFQGGVMFPVWSQLNGTQPAQGIRSFIGITYFFLKGRR